MNEYHPVVLRFFSLRQHTQGELQMLPDLSVLPLPVQGHRREPRRGHVRRRSWPELATAVEFRFSSSFGCGLRSGARARFGLVRGGRSCPA